MTAARNYGHRECACGRLFRATGPRAKFCPSCRVQRALMPRPCRRQAGD